jgi:hypothetical protein
MPAYQNVTPPLSLFSGDVGFSFNNEAFPGRKERRLNGAACKRPEDTSILIPLDSGFLYGTSLRLLVKGFFPRPGRYSIRVIYQSMLPKELVAPQLRNLPALWSDTPSIPSDPVWIEVTQ